MTPMFSSTASARVTPASATNQRARAGLVRERSKRRDGDRKHELRRERDDHRKAIRCECGAAFTRKPGEPKSGSSSLKFTRTRRHPEEGSARQRCGRHGQLRAS
jgi:hypothetical protein